jgi:D-amino-acid oxidase
VRVIVVGAGVIGLSCAVRLAEAGFGAHVLARDLPLETTSAVAAAIWYPYRALPQDRVTAWSRTTYEELCRLAATEPAAGVDVRRGVELLREPAGDPWWRSAIPEFDHLPEAPEGYADGWRFAAPVIDMPLYLAWLTARLEALGGTVTRSWLSALPDAPVLVNCSGLAARRLAGDESVRPVRGQVVRLTRPVGLDEWLLDQSDPQRLIYVIPRRKEVVVGGTAEEGNYDPTPRPECAQDILERARAAVPALAEGRVVAHRVGLRPGRPAVRLDTETRREGRAVVHCYGHGGAGVTLSWGCADEVTAHVHRLVRDEAG